MDNVCKIIIEQADYPLCSIAVNMLTIVLMLTVFRLLNKICCHIIDRCFIKG